VAAARQQQHRLPGAQGLLGDARQAGVAGNLHARHGGDLRRWQQSAVALAQRLVLALQRGWGQVPVPC
jgi:hypothetical protein